MKKIVKNTFKQITPPILQRGIRLLLTGKDDMKEPWKLRESDWYDKIYESSEQYNIHYSQSRYYFMWTVIVDRILKSKLDNIVDIGCGPGQFASLLLDKNIKNYFGIDFSTKSIDLAKETCPSYHFIAADIFKTDILETNDYDCIVALEILEHIKGDKDLIRKIKKGSKFFGSVPNFAHDAHVRFFSDENAVEQRYGEFFKSLRIDPFLGDPKGTTYFLIDGVKK